MGKGNNNNKGKKKQNRDNYFSKNIKTGGENFLENKNINNLIRDAKIVFRDIAYSNIDYDKYYQYFTNNQFMSSLIQAANAELFESSSILNSLNLQLQQWNMSGILVDPAFANIIEKWSRKTTAYQYILNGLSQFMQNPYPEVLLGLSKNLFNLRYDI